MSRLSEGVLPTRQDEEPHENDARMLHAERMQISCSTHCGDVCPNRTTYQ